MMAINWWYDDGDWAIVQWYQLGWDSNGGG